ncbi:lysine 2,3-aminomutase [Catenuloplanes nepalensis]|uniref:Lysine 2,3-aminomutase n=2 Tax=Catenuloplanes nepalensis TaxID=587533 RepID=A0ABT9MSK5_9ACTN|nr:lysine 2,3-aminomutase [Catenuloplanes nepalensis]MDP9794410.1 lysine 2,3-aminomutase [Catenuloplanes nepalensis]
MTATITEQRQPYTYTRRTLHEPDWTRLPGWRHVTRDQWESAQWQRAHCIKNIRQLQHVLGPLADDTLYDDLTADQTGRATMSMLLPPQMLNTMDTTDLRTDPIRRYMLPLASERLPDHPHTTRDSLHEHDMWVADGLTHRYPTKVLAELVPTCPQYCGHCTRMDLVGNDTPTVTKLKLALKPADRHDTHINYLRTHPAVRDVVVSGGDVANVPWRQLETYLMRLLDLDSVRDIRLATKALAGLPQHWLQPHIVEGLERVARTAARRGVNLALHTHINHTHSLTPLVARATQTILDIGVRDVRNQGVLLHGVNDTPEDLLDLCFALHGEAGILPYYFYLCDMIPGAEHWRLPVHHAQTLQHDIMGYLPGYATPRIVCDVPYAGKRWVHMAVDYDRDLGITQWTKNYRTTLTGDTIDTRHRYYDPIHTLPQKGRDHWAAAC